MGILSVVGNSFTLVNTFATIVTMLTFVVVYDSVATQTMCWGQILLALIAIVAQMFASDLHSMAKKSNDSEKIVASTWMLV